MCGIAGIVGFEGRPVFLDEVRAMCATMSHRGPDDDGFYLGPGVALGMRRLSIIDLRTGRQPIGNEDGSIQVVLNGEIYNFRELRRDLEVRGHTFRTSTDTEAIVHLYEEHGRRCVDRLRGMFSFALWDERRHELLLARDRLGIKPLYYTVAGGRLLFASELKALLELPDVGRALDWGAVHRLFTGCHTPLTQSIVAGVRKLPPGHLLIVRTDGRVRLESYWEVVFEPDRDRGEGWFRERLRELLEESVRLHLVSDVPLGAFLSGGIDSSAIVAMTARLTAARVKTFSIGFGEADYDERHYARRVAERFGTEHHELVLAPDALPILDDLAWFLDEPFGDPSAIATYMVSRLAAEHVTVALSGDGGDELFAGYDKYRVERRERRYRYLPAAFRKILGGIGGRMRDGMKGRNFLRHIALDGTDRYLDATMLFKPDQRALLFQREAFERMSTSDPVGEASRQLAAARGDWLSALQHRDLTQYLPLDILTKVDRMSMAHSLEARVPLLDHKLVEFAARLPLRYRLRGGTAKYIFKEAMRGILPDEVIDRPKRGFAVPLGRWFRGQLRGVVHDLLLSEGCRQRGIFNPAYVETLLAMQERGRDLGFQLWTLMSFELWCRRFLDRGGPPWEHGRHAAALVTSIGASAGGDSDAATRA